ncbi:hypothetical protein ACLKA7_001673 [Drosophila subpalustris]
MPSPSLTSLFCPVQCIVNQQNETGENQNVEDSWCWEPAGSEATGPTGRGTTGEPGMVDVALGSATDVAKLNAIIANLEQQNGELRSAMEELDAQHELAMQDVLSHKTLLQTQLTELKNLQADHLVEHELAMARLQAQLVEERERHRSSAQAQLELEQRVAEQDKELQRSVLELAEMQQLLDKRGADNGELIDRVRQADGEREKLQRELDELAKLVKEKKTSESSNSSSTGKHSEDEFIVVRNADAAGSSSDPDPDPDVDVVATMPPSKEKLRDKLVSLESRIAELTATNLKLQDGELERQLASSVLNEQLSELETRLRISESEKEQLQLELQRKLQQLMLQNQELKLSAEADQETHANDLEQQLGALRAENSQLRQDLVASLAQAKFRQAIAEEKQEITDLDDNNDHADNDPHKLRSLLEALLADNSEQALERTHRLLNERWQRLDSAEQRLVDLQDQQLIAEHEKKTLEADISQYILQCDELMKNNELLLNELDKFKRNKLETIEEHHEETIAQLESQLEEAQSQLQRLQQQQQQQLATTTDINEEQVQHLKQLRAELKEKELKLLESQSQLDELKEQLQQLEKMPQLTEQLEQLKAAKSSQEDQLKQVSDELEFKAQQLEEFQVQLTEQAKQMKQLHVQLEDKAKQLQESTQNVEQLEAQLTLKQSNESEQLEELQTQLEQLHTQLESKEKQLQESNELNEQLNSELEKLKSQPKENPEQSRQLEQLERQLSELQEKHQLELEEKRQLRLQQEELKEQLQLATRSAEQSAQIEQQSKVEQLEQLKAQQLETITQLQQTLDTLNKEKLELIKALQQKHAENTQYYAEIQRLQPLEQQLADHNKEREKLCDQINFLKEKSDILTTNLLTEQTNQRLLQQQQVESQEQQVNVQRDLERLRAHLLEIEELHTQESVELQRELDESRAKQAALQQEVSKSSTAYTSASIRANQQAETLQAQHGLVLQQRDELLAKLGQLEDRELKQQAALTNLQCALEQFQNDKQHDIETATQRMRRELQAQLEKQATLQSEMAALQQQLGDANQGLRAAARLSDQLEAGQQTIAVLRDEVDSLKEANQKLKQSLSSSESSQTDKIDKSLIKSLLIGYVVSGHAGDKQQVLRMISSVLDFNNQEAERVGLNKPQSSWLGSILGGGSGSGGSSAQGSGNENLLQAFVQFLEQESQPQSSAQSRPTLLSMGKPLEAAPASASFPPTVTKPAVGPAAAGVEAGATGSNVQQSKTTGTPPTPPMQSLLMSSNEFAPSRNSSSILKDILSDS